MRRDAGNAHALIEHWREAGDDARAPLQFALIEAMARRAADHDGAAREVIDARLTTLLQAYGALLDVPPANEAASTTIDTLGELRAQLQARHDGAQHASYPEHPALADARTTWETLRADRQLRQSLRQAPADAGPLNSVVLVHRAMARMRELSPGYLRHFLAYVDALSWLERLQSGGAMSDPAAPRAAVAKKATRSRTRSRSG